MIAGFWSAASGSRVQAPPAERLVSERVVVGRTRVAGKGTLDDTVTRSLGDSLSLVSVGTVGSLIASDGRSLLLARGVFGAPTVYYAWTDARELLASSTLAGLLQALPRRPPVDLDWLASFACAVPPGEARATPFRGIARLLPGESLLAGAAGLERAQRLPAAESVEWRVAPAEELARELRKRVEDAVVRGCAGVERIAVGLGGLDSSILLAVLASHRGASVRELAAITVDFSDPETDVPYVQDVCRAYGIVPEVVTLRKDGVALPAPLRFSAAPTTIHASPLTLARRATERGAQALALGEGGDMFFGGEWSSMARAATPRSVLPVLRTAATTAFPLRGPRTSLVNQLVFRPWLARIQPSGLRRRRVSAQLRRVRPWMRPTLATLADGAAEAACRSMPTTRLTPERHFAEQASSYLSDLAAETFGHIEHETGIAHLTPFVDTELARFVLAVRPDLLHTARRHRGLARLAMRDLLPASVHDRVAKSDPGELAFASTIAHPAHAHLRDLPRLHDLGWVDREVFAASLSRARGDEDAFVLCPILAVEAFLQAEYGGA